MRNGLTHYPLDPRDFLIEVYQDYYDTLLAWSKKMCRSYPLADHMKEDLVQDVFYRLARYYSKSSEESFRRNPKGYLYTTIRNVAISTIHALRKEFQRNGLFVLATPTDDHSHQTLEDELYNEKITSFMEEKLKPQDVIIFRLYWLGYKVVDIARELGRKTSYVGNRLYRNIWPALREFFTTYDMA